MQEFLVTISSAVFVKIIVDEKEQDLEVHSRVYLPVGLEELILRNTTHKWT